MRFKLLMILSLLGLLVIASGSAMAHEGDDTGAHHMEGGHMWDWWGIPFMGFWMIAIWLVFVVVAILVYKDAERRGMNGLLWFVLVILPWIGILFLIVYLVVREDKAPQSRLQNSSVNILDERYARGDIERESYLRMKKDLKGGT